MFKSKKLKKEIESLKKKNKFLTSTIEEIYSDHVKYSDTQDPFIQSIAGTSIETSYQVFKLMNNRDFPLKSPLTD